ncbi:hypothetical protein CB1_000400003 [Camelus ferus]|nr:hypothetical protein CB1_000400003 [Camelus ferus]
MASGDRKWSRSSCPDTAPSSDNNRELGARAGARAVRGGTLSTDDSTSDEVGTNPLNKISLIRGESSRPHLGILEKQGPCRSSRKPASYRRAPGMLGRPHATRQGPFITYDTKAAVGFINLEVLPALWKG